MPTLNESTNVLANQTIANQIAGNVYEFPGNAGIQIWQVAGAGDLRCNIYFGGRLVAPNISIPLEPAAGRGPNVNEDGLVDEVIFAGERLVIELIGGAAPADVRTRINITPA